jgi:hypothetical protein
MAVYTSYEAIGEREDLMDLITMISPVDTPMFSGFAKTQAAGTYVEWQTDALASAAANAQIEGADYTFPTLSATTRLGNYTQIFNKPFQVSSTLDVVSKAGRDKEYAYQMEKKMKEMARDIEYALVNNSSAVSGASGTARQLKGVLAFITTNVETGSGSGTEALTETMFNDALETISAAGGNPDTVYANGFQKRQISAFTASNTKNVDASANKIVNMVNVYESDFGILEVIYDRAMATDKVAILEKDKWAVASLRPIAHHEVPSIGDSRKGVIEGELTLVAKNEAANGQITQLTTSA